MNKPRNDIIDITKIKRPVLCWWDHSGHIELDVFYPDNTREFLFSYITADMVYKWEWLRTTSRRDEFKRSIVAWQYI